MSVQHLTRFFSNHFSHSHPAADKHTVLREVRHCGQERKHPAAWHLLRPLKGSVWDWILLETLCPTHLSFHPCCQKHRNDLTPFLFSTLRWTICWTILLSDLIANLSFLPCGIKGPSSSSRWVWAECRWGVRWRDVSECISWRPTAVFVEHLPWWVTEYGLQNIVKLSSKFFFITFSSPLGVYSLKGGLLLLCTAHWSVFGGKHWFKWL